MLEEQIREIGEECLRRLHEQNNRDEGYQGSDDWPHDGRARAEERLGEDERYKRPPPMVSATARRRAVDGRPCDLRPTMRSRRIGGPESKTS